MRRCSTILYSAANVALLILCSVEVQAELFTAMVDLEKILYAEHSVAHDLRKYVEKEEQRLARVRRLADDFEKHSTEALSDVEHHLSNPVNAYLLIKRFTSDWNQIIEKEIKSNATEEFLYSLASKTDFFPDQEDLTGAAFALLRLQDTYALPAANIAKGLLQGITDSPRMTALDCFVLGNIAYNNGDYYHTIIWMQQALDTTLEEQYETVDRPTLLDYLSFSFYKQGNLLHALNYTNEWLQLEPNHIRAQNNKNYYEQELREREAHTGYRFVEDKNSINPRPFDGYRAGDAFQTYERLCRGEQTHVRKDLHLLTCQYRRHHPYLYIRPAKEEVMNLNPRMLVYHNLLSDQEVRIVKELATPRLARSVVYHKSDSASTTVQDYRISKSAWLQDYDDPMINRISVKTSFIANLSLETAEQLQVLNYGIGGHYETHYDFATNRELSAFEKSIGNRVATFICYHKKEVDLTFGQRSGNRIATVMCYLSDVPAGGATVFPTIGVRLSPRKGSCALWYNLLPSGEGDMRTNHAACPVLTGFKWVCNKWFHERGQEFIRPCKTTPYE